MSNVEERFHAEWIGMVQPIDGLVVSVPVLVDAQCMSHQQLETQERLRALLREVPRQSGDELAIDDIPRFLDELLGLASENWRTGEAIASLYLDVPEGHQTLRPTAALAHGDGFGALLWDLGPDLVGLDLERPETKTGSWDYPALAKFERLLRHCRVPVGILTNRTQVRLVYAPHGESSGAITFRLADMATVGGRPILDAFVMLLGAARWYGVARERQLPAILAESRKRQANVTNELADQVLEALTILLDGFQAAAERDRSGVLEAAQRRTDDHVYAGLLTFLLRLVFVLYAEDRNLLPVDNELYARHFSLLGLFQQLQQDRGAFPDTMSRRFGAYGRLVTLFRALYLGVEHGALRMPARRGQLFSPHEFPFLEGWQGEPGSAPIVDPAARAEVQVPSVDDDTVFRALEKLLVLRHQRLSYRALDVEQIGSVYEALMGYHVVQLDADAVCLKPSRVWVTGEEVLAQKPATRARWLQNTAALGKAQAEKVAKALVGAADANAALVTLAELAVRGTPRGPMGRLVIQPGHERRRTSSHYTPRTLTEGVVRTTLEPLLTALGLTPTSLQILDLKICDPAMGSGAFLVEACRFLADEVVRAWQREGEDELIHGAEDVTLVARRMVAQRCLYGVDKNPFAVNLAKLSLWLTTLAKDLPFTFLDHALRHGDSLVGLSLEQITAFHWKPKQQLDLCQTELEATLGEAVAARQQIHALASDASTAGQKEKEWLLRDAEDALGRVRLIGDLVIGAFFAATSDKEREKERTRCLDLVLAWLQAGGPPPAALVELQAELQARVPAFHWMVEFPEVFWVQRPDPLAGGKTDGRAWIDAFVGNPPFAGKNNIAEAGGEAYVDWLKQLHSGAHGNADLSAHFFRRADVLLGEKGAIGLIATNTIAQGDTRATGLKFLVDHGHVIYAATRSMPWPGDAAVSVSVVHLAKAVPIRETRILNSVLASSISSRLRAMVERPDPVPLRTNANRSFIGSYILGKGFVLTREQRDVLLAKNPLNAQLIFPYINGEEANTLPPDTHERFVINFGEMTVEQAEHWPDLLSIVRENVKPERDLNNRDVRRKYWWRFGETSAALYTALRGRERALVTVLSGKHRVFTFLPASWVLDQGLVVFPEEGFATFTVLSSRVHESWSVLLSASLKSDNRYIASDCFAPFPFPTELATLETVGTKLYRERADYMVRTQQGLTQTYNLLKDPECRDAEIERLRALHVDMDRAVLAAYGWSDLAVPPYLTPSTDDERRALQAFEDEVIDRLFEENAKRAETERIIGGGTPAARGKAKKGSRKNANAAQLGFDDEG